MTSTAIALVPGNNNAVNYNNMLKHAKDLGASIKTSRDRQRHLARTFVLSATDDGYQLEGLIEDAKEALGWNRLQSDEKNRMNVLFTQCRTIVGKWAKLTDEVKQTFRDGKLVYSTLVKAIKDAEKEAAKAEAEAEKAEAVAEEASKAAEADIDPVVAALKAARLLIEAGEFKPEQLAEVARLAEALDQFRANIAKQVVEAKAA